MSTRIQQLVAVFEARFDGFLGGLKQAGTQTQAFGAQAAAAFQSVEKTVSRVSTSTVVALDHTAKATQVVSHSYVEYQKTVETAAQVVVGAQAEMADAVVDAQAKVVEATTKAEAGAEEAAKRARERAEKLSSLAGKIETVAGKIGSGLYNVLAPVVTESAKAGFALIKLKDDALASFEGILGNEAKAKTLLQDLGDLAARTPFELPGLVETSKKLLAAGMSAEQIVPTLTSVGNAVARVGGSPESIEAVTTALGQMLGESRITSDSMKALTEAGIDPWKALAQTIGTDVPTAMKLVEQGAVQTDQVLSGFVANLGANAAGAMAAQNQTLTGLLATLQEKFDGASATIFEPLYRRLTEFLAWAMGPSGLSLGPLVEHLQGAVQQISDNVFGFLQQDGQRVIDLLVPGLMSMADCIITLSDLFRDWAPTVVDAAEGIGVLAGWISKVLDYVPGLTTGLQTIAGLFLVGIPVPLKGLMTLLTSAVSSFGLLNTAGVAAGVAIGVWLYKNNEHIKEFNRQLERSAILQNKMATLREGRVQETLQKARAIEDPEERKKFLREEADRAKKELHGKENQLTMAKDEVTSARKAGWYIPGNKVVAAAKQGVTDAEAELEAARKALNTLELEITNLSIPQAVPSAAKNPPPGAASPAAPPTDPAKAADADADRNKEIATAEIEAAERSDKMLEGLGDILEFIQSGASPQQVEAMAKTFAGATPELAAALAQALAQGGDPRAASEEFVRGANENVAREDRAKTADQAIDKVQGEFGSKLPAFALAEFNKGLQILQNQFVSGAITEEQFRAGLQSIENASRNTIAVQNELKSSMEQYGKSLTGPFKAKFEELQAQLSSGAISVDQFRKEVKGLTEASQKAAEAEKRRKLIAGDFAGAGLNLQQAVEERLASKKMQEFNTMVDNIVNRMTGFSGNVNDASKSVASFSEKLSPAAEVAEKTPSAQEIADFWRRLASFMETIDGQRALILNQLALLRQSMQITKDALSQRELQAKIDDLIRALQVLDQQEAALPTFIGDRGELEFKDPGLSKDGGGGGRRGVFGPDGNGGGGGISLSFPNLTRITQTEASLLADAVVRETSRRGRALSR